jgi:signal transduction histidine kinase
MNAPRFTVTHKIIAGLVLILLIGLLSMLLIYRGLVLVEQELERLAAVEEPTSLAAYEMEINVNGMGLAVLKYLDDVDPFYRSWVSDDDADFNVFLREYLNLVNTRRERTLGREVSALFEEFEQLAQRLMEEKDRQAALFEAVAANFEQMDRIIDERVQPAIDRRGPEALAKIEASMDMEASIAEMAFWTIAYQEVSSQEHRRMIFDKEQEFKQALSRIKQLDLLQEKVTLVAAIQAIGDQTHRSVLDIVALEDRLDENTARLIDLRLELDNLLDDEIQPLALADLTAPRIAANRAAEQVLHATGYLILIYILAAALMGMLLVRVINRPLRALMAGTASVGRGDLDYRIRLRGGDEFADLAAQFDLMVDQLQATTVSKKLLEASEAKLQATIADLKNSIAERERAQAEHARLQAKLRRSETMAAMGSLMAGVAHEVRNPLFGISSTLDAMSVRFGEREEYQRYSEVLREELNRLGQLMQTLLEYGKPSELALAPGALADAVKAAIQACAPLAVKTQVAIANRVPPDLSAIYMDRSRLTQVFQNLLQNAIQHAPPGSIVTIEAAEVQIQAARWIRCEVKDAGPGFDEEDAERIFDPFFSRRRGGTGLGLAIVRRIVEEHKGEIVAANRPGGGAVMIVRLPIAPEATPRVVAPPHSA